MITRYSDFVFEPKKTAPAQVKPVLEGRVPNKKETPLKEGLLDNIASSMMELPIPVDIRRNYGEEDEEEEIEDYFEEPKEKHISDFIDPAYIKSTGSTFIPEPEEIEDETIFNEPQIPMDPLAYKIFRDKAESFECKVMIEGSDVKNTAVRLILESDEWNIFFKGSINGGICRIPLKKISILSPGLIGVIKLEVVVDGEIFYPWYETFQVQNSKNVKVEVLSQKQNNQAQSGTRVRIA
jgi:hypothetical protein